MGTKKCNAPVLCLSHNLPPACAKKAMTDKGSTSLYPTLKSCENELWPPVRIKKGLGPHSNQSPTKASKKKQYRSREAARGTRSQEARSIMLSKIATPPFLWHSLGWITTNLSTIQQSLVFTLAYPCDLVQRQERKAINNTAFLTHQWDDPDRKINKIQTTGTGNVHFNITCEHVTLFKTTYLQKKKEKNYNKNYLMHMNTFIHQRKL